MKNINLGRAHVPVDQFASQANAILGIRGSGKTYTGTGLAEQLLDAGVPITVLDPIGMWRFLRVPRAAKAYPVVIAGGQHGDLPLPVKGAAEIMRAAMRDGVSIVFDLYDVNLSKRDWRSIVTDVVKVLLYENKAHALRHVFIEEAAEFVPQKVGPDHGMVYGICERLVRMGGNAQLGVSLINQRAEEVNKAVLELCDLLVLHRQKGRRSLENLSHWLDVAAVSIAKEVAAAVPILKNGEAFVWPEGAEQPTRTVIPEKNTFHPDRRKMAEATLAWGERRVGAGAFAEKLTATLASVIKEAEARDPDKLLAEIRRLNAELAKKKPAAEVSGMALMQANDATIKEVIAKAERASYARGNADGKVEGRADALQPMMAHAAELQRVSGTLAKITSAIYAAGEDAKRQPKAAPQAVSLVATKPRPIRGANAGASTQPAAPAAGKVSRPQQKILDGLAWLKGLGIDRADRVRAAMLADQSPRSSGYEKNVSTLKIAGLIDYPSAGELALTPAGEAQAAAPDVPATNQALHEAIRRHVSGPQWRLLEVLIDIYPKALTRQELAERANVSAVSSGFEKNVSTIRSLGFIDYPAQGSLVALPVLFIT